MASGVPVPQDCQGVTDRYSNICSIDIDSDAKTWISVQVPLLLPEKDPSMENTLKVVHVLLSLSVCGNGKSMCNYPIVLSRRNLTVIRLDLRNEPTHILSLVLEERVVLMGLRV